MKFKANSGNEIELIVVEDHEATAKPCADFIEKVIRQAADSVASICFSTGSSPIPVYRELVRRHREEGLSFSNVHAFLLDEYVGLPVGHAQCFRTYMQNNLFRHVDIRTENMHLFFGPQEDHMQTCFRYEREIKDVGGMSLMILGIGPNGHIAFNEPGVLPDSRTRMIKLTESTRRANARFFNSIDEVPTHALSVGIANILEADKVLLIATGESKIDAVRRAFADPVDNQVPASHLQNFTGELAVVTDKAAVSGLNL